jgi:hypothetical protein
LSARQSENAEAEHVGVEGHDSLHVADAIGDVAELERRDAGGPAVLLGKSVVGKNIDSHAFGIVERDRFRDPGGNVAPPFGLDAFLSKRARKRREIESRRHLKRESGERIGTPDLERDRLQALPARQERALWVARDQRQADDLDVVIDGPIEVGRCQGRMTQSSDLNHFPSRSSQPTQSKAD